MRGSLRKRGGSWIFRVDLERDPVTGKRHQKTFSFKLPKPEAEKKATEILSRLDAGAVTQSSAILLKDYLKRWLTDYAYPQLSPTTAQGYESIINNGITPALGMIPLSKLTRERIQAYYTQKAGSTKASTVVHHHTCLHKALETAVEWNLLVRNPCDKAKPPKAEHPEMLCWNEWEIEKFLRTAQNTPYYALFYMVLYSGMRRSEILALRWRDIDLDNSRAIIWRSVHRKKGGGIYFRNPKTKQSARAVALTKNTIKVIKDYKLVIEAEKIARNLPFSEDDRLFETSPDQVTHRWRDTAIKAGVKVIRLHDGRHSYASLLFKKNVHPKIVQGQLGHSSVQITLDTYSHLLPGVQEQVIDSLDEK